MDPAFLWTRDRCAEDDIPDAPLRAVRLDDDHVIAFATHEQNRAFSGPNLGTLKRDCRIVFAGRHSDRPEDYSDRIWIASTWSEDGRTIFALGHDEYQAHRHPGRCRFATYAECWWNAIVLLRSDDGGRNFSRVGDRPVATIPSRQDIDQGHSRGFYEPSNIVKRGDAYYALIRAGGEGAQQAGTCLFRTNDLTRPESLALLRRPRIFLERRPLSGRCPQRETMRADEGASRKRRVSHLCSRVRSLCRCQRLWFEDIDGEWPLLFRFDRPDPLERGATFPATLDTVVGVLRRGPFHLSVARRPPLPLSKFRCRRARSIPLFGPSAFRRVSRHDAARSRADEGSSIAGVKPDLRLRSRAIHVRKIRTRLRRSGSSAGPEGMRSENRLAIFVS